MSYSIETIGAAIEKCTCRANELRAAAEQIGGLLSSLDEMGRQANPLGDWLIGKARAAGDKIAAEARAAAERAGALDPRRAMLVEAIRLWGVPSWGYREREITIGALGALGAFAVGAVVVTHKRRNNKQ